MNNGQVVPHSPTTPGRVPASPSRPPLHPGSNLTPHSSIHHKESPRISANRRQSAGTAQPSPVPLAFGSSVSSNPVPYKDTLRLGLNTQSMSMGNSSPSDSYYQRYYQGDNRSPTSSIASSRGNTERLALTKSMNHRRSLAITGGVARKQSDTQSRSLSILLVLSKTIMASVILIGGIVLGTLIVTDSADWIYSISTNTSPLITCPSSVEALGTQYAALDGTSCEMKFSFVDYTSFNEAAINAFQIHNQGLLTSNSRASEYQCFQLSPYTSCSNQSACQVRCFSSTSCSQSIGSGTCSEFGVQWGGSAYPDPSVLGTTDDCMQTIFLSGTNYPITGAAIGVVPLCGDNLKLSPGMIQTLRGTLLAVIVMTILVGLSLMIKAKVAPSMTPLQSQKAILIGKASANEMKAMVEDKWDSEFQTGNVAITPAAGGSLPSALFPSQPPATSHLGQMKGSPIHPAKNFASSSWKYRVRVMHAMLKKRKSLVKRDFVKKSIFAILLIISISMASTILLLKILPKNLPNGGIVPINPGGAVGPSRGWYGIVVSLFSSWYSSSGWVDGVWIDGLVMLDIASQLVVVLITCGCGLKWNKRLCEGENRKYSDISSSEDACMILTVPSGSCLRSKSREKLLRSIESALDDLRLGAVFVVDLGSGSNTPLDDTWKLVSHIDPMAVHYIYLPDNHKQLAAYWTSQIWIPFLYKSGRIGRVFKQIFLVDFDHLSSENSLGSAVTLGELNKTLLTADAAMLDGGGAVVMFPSRVADGADFTTSWENMRLSSEFFSRITESSCTSGLVTSLNPNGPIIWDRRGMEVVASNRGLAALQGVVKKRGKINVSTSTCCDPIPVKDTIYDHYKAMSETFLVGQYQMLELFSPSSFTNGQSIVLKLFLTIGPVLSMILVILRPFILGSLVFRDPLCLTILIGLFWALSVVSNGVEKFASWNRYPAVPGSLATYPIYQVYMESMRIGLSLGGSIFGRLKDDEMRPSICSHKELYPCPPHPDIDWFTVWRTSDSTRLSVLSTAIQSTSPTNHSRSMSAPENMANVVSNV